jgi:hypothetical protein
MDLRRAALAAVSLLLAMSAASAADSPLLIQIRPDGSYRVWHTEGQTRLSEDELLTLAASARPEGGEVIEVGAGKARAYEVPQAVMIEIPGAAEDKALLVDRDECGGIKVWHAAGPTQLSEAEMTELVLSALPTGGKRLTLGTDYAKAFTNRLGVVVVIWKPPRRP